MTPNPEQSTVMSDTNPTVSPVPSVATSLPPSSGAALAPPSLSKNPAKKLKPNSLIRKKALAIVALRAAGYDNAEIGRELGIATASVHQYLWRATKAGYLVDRKTGSLLVDPKDEVEFDLQHRAVRNLREMLDSDDDAVRNGATLEVAKSTLFKRFDPAKEQTMPSMNVLQVKIEMPQTGQVAVREGTMGGTPNYAEGFADGELVGQDRDE